VDTALSEAVGRGWLTVTERGRSQLLTLSDTGTARLALEAR
jgi:DNA-binding transcriptional regulator PaaX